MKTKPNGVSLKQHGYYRSTIVPAIAAHCGYESHAEAHRALKAGFYGMHPDSPDLPSMAAMTDEEATRFIDWSIRQAAEMHLVIRDPERRQA